MDVQVERYQPLISRRVIYGLRTLPRPPIITRRMEFGMRSLRHCLNRPETPEPSQYSSYHTSDTLPPARSLSVNPSTLPTSRFSGSDQPSEYTPTPSHSVDTRNHIPGRDKTVKFRQMENDDSLSLLSDSEEEDIDGNKKLIPKP